MTETEWLFSEIRRQFGDRPLRTEVHDWLLNHQWEIMKHMFPGCEGLLNSVTDDTYDRIVEDLVTDEFGDGLAERLIDLGVDLREDE